MKTCKKVYVKADGSESTTTSADAVRLEFRFTNGKKVVVNFAKLSANIQAAAMRHGIAQKIGDSFASSESVEASQAAAEETLAQLLAGDWNTRTSGSGNLAEAVGRVQKVSTEKAAAVIAKLTPENLAKLKAAPQVKAMLATIAAEKAQAKAQGSDVDLSALLKV